MHFYRWVNWDRGRWNYLFQDCQLHRPYTWPWHHSAFLVTEEEPHFSSESASELPTCRTVRNVLAPRRNGIKYEYTYKLADVKVQSLFFLSLLGKKDMVQVICGPFDPLPISWAQLRCCCYPALVLRDKGDGHGNIGLMEVLHPKRSPFSSSTPMTFLSPRLVSEAQL